MDNIVALDIKSCKTQEVDWENWFLKGAEALKEVVSELARVSKNGGSLEDMSNALWKNADKILAPVFTAAIQDKADAMQEPAECPGCGKSCKASRKLPRKLETRSGVVSIERYYHHCSRCKVGFFPFDDLLGLTSDRKQADLQRAALQLFTEVPFETAAKLFQNLTGMSFSDHAMHDLSNDMSATIEIENCLPTFSKIEELVGESTVPGQWKPVVVVSADGAHVPTRPEANSRNEKRGVGEWREAKGFRVYIASHDRIIQLMSWHQIQNEEEFGKSLEYAASLLSHDEVRIALVGDGAPWVWKHMTKCFPSGQEILDYYHCKEHIYKVANTQYGVKTERAQEWIEATMSRLHFGEVQSVIWGLQRMKAISSESAEEIRKLITYLKNNENRIDYARAKRRQFPRGSGGIESSNKAVCHTRMKRSGSWWYEENANTLLALRCAKANSTLDDVYRKHLDKMRLNRNAKRFSKLEKS